MKPAPSDDDDPMSTLSTQMLQLLDPQAALGWKPVAELSVAEIRKLPTLTDAAARLLRQQGKAASDGGVTTQDLQYGTVAPQLARMLR